MTHMPGPTLSLPSDGQNVDECKLECYQLQCKVTSEHFWWLSVCIKVCACMCMSSGGGGLTSVVAAIERLGQLATAGPASSEQVEPSSDVCRCCHRGLTCSPPPTWATCHQPPEAAPASTSATLQPDFRNHSPEVHRDKKGS